MKEQAAIDAVRRYTKSSQERIEAMVDALHRIRDEKIAGDIVEIGVWRAGNIMLAKMLAPERTCWLYDTFAGMTEPDPELDVKRNGERAIDRYIQKQAGGTRWDAVSMDEVKDGFIALGLDMDNLHFVEGPAELTLDTVAPTRIAILRLDADWYSPTKKALEKLYGRVSVGGYLIVDDYGHWMGCRKAVDEYFDVAAPPFVDVDYTCRVYRKL